MIQYQCQCGQPFPGKNGQRKLNEHIAKKKTPHCSPRNISYFSGVKAVEKKQ